MKFKYYNIIIIIKYGIKYQNLNRIDIHQNY